MERKNAKKRAKVQLIIDIRKLKCNFYAKRAKKSKKVVNCWSSANQLSNVYLSQGAGSCEGGIYFVEGGFDFVEGEATLGQETIQRIQFRFTN